MTEEKFKEMQDIKDEISLVKTELRKLEKLFHCCSLVYFNNKTYNFIQKYINLLTKTIFF